MKRTQQSFFNRRPWPIYISVEPWPRCFELLPNEKLTLIWDAPEAGDAAEIELLSDKEIVVYPEGEIDEIAYLIDGMPARDRDWDFRYFTLAKPKKLGLLAAIKRGLS